MTKCKIKQFAYKSTNQRNQKISNHPSLVVFGGQHKIYDMDFQIMSLAIRESSSSGEAIEYDDMFFCLQRLTIENKNLWESFLESQQGFKGKLAVYSSVNSDNNTPIDFKPALREFNETINLPGYDIDFFGLDLFVAFCTKKPMTKDSLIINTGKTDTSYDVRINLIQDVEMVMVVCVDANGLITSHRGVFRNMLYVNNDVESKTRVPRLAYAKPHVNVAVALHSFAAKVIGEKYIYTKRYMMNSACTPMADILVKAFSTKGKESYIWIGSQDERENEHINNTSKEHNKSILQQ
jgi:hypothetical protein